jgi:epoxyqueuosine reductase QueG
VDPQQVLPGARSIISLAVSYALQAQGPEAGRDASARRPYRPALSRATRATRITMTCWRSV